MKLRLYISLILILGVLSACTTAQSTTQPEATQPPAQIANPASENCIEQGGTLSIETRGDEGEFGVCYFEDNRQCEEWALLRGDCPVGGLKVTGYITPAARYCAITGGTYAITAASGSDDEQGTCTFKDGLVCDVWEYWYGTCSAGEIPAQAPASEWQTYTNAPVGYSLQVPTGWGEQMLLDQNEGAIHGMAYTGAEGGVEVYWGVGFGGACPTGTQPVQLAQTELEACYVQQSDGTAIWSQIGYEVSGGNSFSVRAYTSDAQPASHDLVLQVLATLTFMPPEAAALTIQPLSMEVCDGQAQAMSHTLDDLIPTQSEEPISDPVNGASGTGCQATITGNGVQFESPTAVVTELGAMLADQGWSADPMLVADGATGTAAGYRKDDQLCWAGAGWTPDASANCPPDQPVSTCVVAPEQQLYTVTLNCGVEVPVGQAGEEAEVAQIVFDSTRAGPYRDLYVLDITSGEATRLTHSEANNLAGPWSPDGLRIAYTGYGLTNSYIGVMNADGSDPQPLSQVSGSDEGFPDWSPDGLRIAFTSRRDGNNEIYVMNADGSNPVRLTDQPGDDFAPSWSPDGTRIAFVSDRDQGPGIYDLYIMNADSSNVVRLTNDTAIDYSPDWSPDGQAIVFRSHHDGAGDIYVINVDGSGLRNLTDNPAEDWAPSWSPDCLLIAFQSNRDGNWEIYRMAADGADPLNITLDPADDQNPFWKP